MLLDLDQLHLGLTLKTVDDPWSIDNRVGNSKAAWSYDFSSYQLAKNILCGDSPCFDSVTDIYVSSVAESGAALEVTMKGLKMDQQNL